MVKISRCRASLVLWVLVFVDLSACGKRGTDHSINVDAGWFVNDAGDVVGAGDLRITRNEAGAIVGIGSWGVVITDGGQIVLIKDGGPPPWIDSGVARDGAPVKDAKIARDAAPRDAAPRDAAPRDGARVDASPPDAALSLPAVSGLTTAQPVKGDVTVNFVVSDAKSAAVEITVDVSNDGGKTWRTARTTGKLVGLSSSPGGTAASLVWDTLRDVGFRNPAAAILRVTPKTSQGTGSAATLTITQTDNIGLRKAAMSSYIAYFGQLDSGAIAHLQVYDLAIVHPLDGNIKASELEAVKRGVNANDPADDVMVACYLSIGEDIRTSKLSDTQLLADTRFVGDKSGPRVDPRASASASFAHGKPLGDPSPTSTGYASWYLDDANQDGKPDRSTSSGACYVNAGDPKWFDALRQMSIDGVDKVAGLDELLTTSSGRAYGCDGVFLDTIDTAAPNYFSASLQSEWTAPGFTDFIGRLKTTYPGKVIVQNRGVFFFDVRQKHFPFHAGNKIDFLLFEGYRLNANTWETYNAYFAADNATNFAPKIVAEAQRPDGFTVLSLGYAAGPGIKKETLRGASTDGQSELDDDIAAAQEVGFRHYITDATVTYYNPYVRIHGLPNLDPKNDTSAPEWSGTYNANVKPYPTPSDPPEATVGIQQVELAKPLYVTVRWSVALDINRVHYVLYYQTQPFDFVNDPSLSSATRVTLTPAMPTNYSYAATSYPFEAEVGPLTAGTKHYFVIRAVDAVGNEDDNQEVVEATPFK
ncbi:MAG: hypothetical protein H6707_07285 [Deltaproteobacteria bacterium]|nr:hypothetical protein [Deltaproteobacteria bacterium]